MNLDRSLCPSAAYTRGDKETQAIHALKEQVIGQRQKFGPIAAEVLRDGLERREGTLYAKGCIIWLTAFSSAVLRRFNRFYAFYELAILRPFLSCSGSYFLSANNRESPLSLASEVIADWDRRD